MTEQRFTVESELVGRERYPMVRLTFPSDPRMHHMLAKDDAVHLANRLTDAVDELELAEAVSGDELSQQIRRRNAAEALAYWDGFDAALTAVEEGQPLYGTTKKAVAALRVASKIGRGITEHDLATTAEAVSGE